MDRLTTHDEKDFPLIIRSNDWTWRCIYDRLAAYEDTGLIPEQIKLLSNILQDVGETYNERFECVRDYITNPRLRELAEADKDDVDASSAIFVRCPEDCMNMEWDIGNDVTPPSGECRCMEVLDAAGICEVAGSEDTTVPICPAYLTQKTVEKYFWDMHAGEYERIDHAQEMTEKALEATHE